MNDGIKSRSVLKLVNLARAAYGANELETLIRGQLRSASFCTIGRSLRFGAEEWLFIAVGSRYLRLWALGKDSAAVADQIRKAWGMPSQLLIKPTEKSGCVMLALPPEMCEFLDRFDRGLLPDYEGEVSDVEELQLTELAHKVPTALGKQRSFGHFFVPEILPRQRCNNSDSALSAG